MKRLGISQRVEVIKSHGERRDCLDQQWSPFTLSLGYAPIPLSNVASAEAESYLTSLGLDAVLLSGGNSLMHLNPQADDAAPERDNFERSLIDFALKEKLPLIGVCRGMQMLNHYFGGRLTQCSGHVAARHGLAVSPSFSNYVENTVNSFHNYAIGGDDLGEDLQSFATSPEGHVEAFIHNKQSVCGIMWHPEREAPHRPKDLSLFRKVLQHD